MTVSNLMGFIWTTLFMIMIMVKILYLYLVAVVEAKMDKSDLNHSYNFDRQAYRTSPSLSLAILIIYSE